MLYRLFTLNYEFDFKLLSFIHPSSFYKRV